MKTKAATEGLEKQVSDGVARFAKEHNALTQALAAAREEHAACVVALRKQHALALSSLEKEHASVGIASLKADLPTRLQPSPPRRRRWLRANRSTLSARNGADAGERRGC